MNRHFLGLAAFLATQLLLTPRISNAQGVQPPRQFPYAGTLEIGGRADADVAMRFRLCGSVAGDDCPWAQDVPNVAVRNRRFSVTLGGADTAFPAEPNLFDGRELWLEVSVDGRVLGRQRVLSVPTAIEAAGLRSRLDALDAAARWRVDATIAHEAVAPADRVLPLGRAPGVDVHAQNGQLQLRTHEALNSADAQLRIACANEAPALERCGAGNEAFGISFMPPAASRAVRVCTTFSHYAKSTVGCNGPFGGHVFFRLMETAENSAQIEERGRTSLVSHDFEQGGGVTPVVLCDTFAVSAGDRVTIRLIPWVDTQCDAAEGGFLNHLLLNEPSHWTVEAMP